MLLEGLKLTDTSEPSWSSEY